MPAEAYSSLEVMHYDQSANAPQRDHAKCPPELDTAVLAPQALVHAGTEVAYDTTPPEVLDVGGNSASPSTEKVKSTAFLNHWSSRQMVLVICVVSAAITVIVAVGIRFGPASKKSTSSTIAAAQPTEILSQPHGILNDSALAAVEMPNGDRRVFFQENDGNIRQAVYIESRKQWSASLTNIVVEDAKKHTPLAAVAIQTFDVALQKRDLYLFYIAANNSLSVAYWSLIFGDSWFNGGRRLRSHTPAASSRLLSVSVIDSPLRFYLFYEDMNGSLTILRNSPNYFGVFESLWVDVTNDIRGQFSGIRVNFSAPFSSIAYQNQLAICLNTEFDQGLSMSICNVSERCDFRYNTPPMPGVLRDLDIKIVDFPNIWPLVGIWTNSSVQKLQISQFQQFPQYQQYQRITPEPPFPFSRIASISSNTSKEFPVIIYHQLTEFVLVEEIWEITNRIWLKNTITI